MKGTQTWPADTASFLIISEPWPTSPGMVLLFYAPHERGYTDDVDKAGRYTLEDALRIHSPEHGTYMVPVDWALQHCRRVVFPSDIGGRQALQEYSKGLASRLQASIVALAAAVKSAKETTSG